MLGHVLWPCDVTFSEYGRDHSLLLGGDSFVNGACQDLPGDGPQAWTMAIAQGELPLGAGAGRLAPIAGSVSGFAGAAGRVLLRYVRSSDSMLRGWGQLLVLRRSVP